MVTSLPNSLGVVQDFVRDAGVSTDHARTRLGEHALDQGPHLLQSLLRPREYRLPCWHSRGLKPTSKRRRANQTGT